MSDKFFMSWGGFLKLTTSLVNVSLKFKTLILQIHCYFLLEKCENLLQCKDSHIFPTKNNSVFDNVVGLLTSLGLRCFEQLAPDSYHHPPCFDTRRVVGSDY